MDKKKDDATSAIVIILLLAGGAYYIYKQNQTKIDTASKVTHWWSSIF